MHEPHALVAWGGCGTVLLHGCDDERFAMLLERTRPSILAEVKDGDEAVAVAGRPQRRLTVPAPSGPRRGCDPARVNDLGDAHLRTWTLRLMALLSADRHAQLAWLSGQETETTDVVEEVELLCRVAEGLTERGVLAPGELRDLGTIGRRLGTMDASCRAGFWADALSTDPAWDDIRTLARQFLVTSLGDWRQPLPRPARTSTGNN